MATTRKRTEEVAEEQVERISRVQAANRVVAELNGKTSLEQLAGKADSLVVESGGESKLRTSKHHVRRALETMEALGVVRLTKPTDVLVERVKK